MSGNQKLPYSKLLLGWQSSILEVTDLLKERLDLQTAGCKETLDAVQQKQRDGGECFGSTRLWTCLGQRVMFFSLSYSQKLLQAHITIYWLTNKYMDGKEKATVKKLTKKWQKSPYI